MNSYISIETMLINFLKNLPFIDIGTGHMRHNGKSKKIAFSFAQKDAFPGSTVLDMGCFDGYWSEKLSGLGYRVTSIDIEKHYPKTQIVDLDKSLPFADASFDLVWSTDVIEHLDSPSATAQEIKRILKPKGIMIVSTNNSFFWIYPIMKLFGYSAKELQNPGHKQFFSYADVRALFPRAQIYGFLPYTLVKFTISHPTLLHYLSPTFVMVARREEL